MERTRRVLNPIQRRNQIHQKELPVPRKISRRRVKRASVPIARKDSIQIIVIRRKL